MGFNSGFKGLILCLDDVPDELILFLDRNVMHIFKRSGYCFKNIRM